MKIDIKRFRFVKSKKGKKFHIFPKNRFFNKSLCLMLDKDEIVDNRNEIENVCKVCAKEYEIVKDSSSFRMCVG